MKKLPELKPQGTFWETADWRHEFEPVDKSNVNDTPYCEGDNDACRCCQDAARDARYAQKWADKARDVWAQGHGMRALQYAHDAMSVEIGWGDAPTHRPLYEEMKAILDKLDTKENDDDA